MNPCCKEEIKKVLKVAGEKAQTEMAKKYGTYNYDFMEGVFTIEFFIKDLIDKEDSELMISHGKITHPIGQKCKICDENQKVFEQKFKIPLKRLIRKETNKVLKRILKSGHGGGNFRRIIIQELKKPKRVKRLGLGEDK